LQVLSARAVCRGADNQRSEIYRKEEATGDHYLHSPNPSIESTLASYQVHFEFDSDWEHFEFDSD
jgi:hypothetical protein